MYIIIDNTKKLRNLLTTIFTDQFMAENTNFESFEYFKYSSAVICNWEAPKMVYNEELLNLFVKESTVFQTFDEMVKAAVDVRFSENANKQGEAQ